MDAASIIRLPIMVHEAASLERIIKDAGVMVAGNYQLPEGPWLLPHLSAGHFGKAKFHALFDRNLISPIVRLAAGGSVSLKPEDARIDRLACAAFAFCICADILIEPGMALHEYASSASNHAAREELRCFRIADNCNPRFFLNIALGLADAIPPAHLQEVAQDPLVQAIPSKEGDFAKSLDMWPVHYLHVLKTLYFIRSGLRPVEAAKAFMNWQARDSFFNGVATMYCLAAMSYQPPKGDMLKGVGSQNVSLVRKGAANATWDICFLRQFGRYVTGADARRWSLWSDDFALKAIARTSFIPDADPEDAKLEAFFFCFWGKDAKQLLRLYRELAGDIEPGSSKRQQQTEAAFARIDQDVRELEEHLGIAGI